MPNLPLSRTASLLSATSQYGNPIPTYCDGEGDPLWILRDSMGVTGIIQASTWEDAWEIAQNEMFPESDLTWEQMAADCDCNDPDNLMDSPIFQEGYGFRPNGANATDKLRHGIYAHDLNGERLDRLTDAGVKAKGITLVWEDSAEEPVNP